LISKEKMPNATRHQGKRFFVSRLFGEKGSLIIFGIAVPFFSTLEKTRATGMPYLFTRWFDNLASRAATFLTISDDIFDISVVQELMTRHSGGSRNRGLYHTTTPGESFVIHRR
jgi:hypothetical protein